MRRRGVWNLQATDPSASPRILRDQRIGVHAINAVAFSPDGHSLATVSDDTMARVWDLQAADPSASPRILRGHDDAVKGVAFSPDGQYLATGSNDHTARGVEFAGDRPERQPNRPARR